MSKVVCLRLEQGDFSQGFRVSLDIADEGKFPHIFGVKGFLRQAPELPELYKNWQTKYCNLESSYRRNRLHFTDQQTTVSTIQDCQIAAEKLKIHFQQWLECDEFRTIDRTLRTNLNPSEQVRVILQTDNEQLRKLPWEFWDFFQSFSHADLGISPPISSTQKRLSYSRKIKILAILGNDDGINIQADKKILEQLPLADVHFLVQPSHKEFSELWEKPWDVLFFAGHSSSQDGETGCIYINPTPEGRLEIHELEQTLKKAIQNGLKLAIFNSCDGLGLASQLEKLGIPQAIVMREPVPDEVAQEFLKSFLFDLANGIPLYTAVRNTRNKLRELERIEQKFPGASWLPVICQNPTTEDFVWSQPQPKFWRSFVQQFQQYGSTAIASGLIGGAIALSIILPLAGDSRCSETEKNVGNVCFKDPRKTVLTIGILAAPHQPIDPKIEYRYGLFKDYLKKTLGDQVSEIQVEIGNNLSYRQVQNKIRNKAWDIVFAYSPMNSWEAQNQGYGWLARKDPYGKGHYYSVLFVNPNSKIRSLDDIKPTTKIALGPLGSASSFHFPIYTLYGKKFTLIHTSSHEEVAELVKAGKADIGASLIANQSRDEWRIIHISEQILVGGVFVSPKLASSDQAEIKQAFWEASEYIKRKADYKVTPPINYEFMGKIARRVDELISCGVDLYDSHPIHLMCKPETAKPNS
jgi:ABC-type phosphate/phosphonate transport system substrate-binding protein